MNKDVSFFSRSVVITWRFFLFSCASFGDRLQSLNIRTQVHFPVYRPQTESKSHEHL
nr:MAG TPA: hypothetical protein [Caudoviricetes sp.]